MRSTIAAVLLAALLCGCSTTTAAPSAQDTARAALAAEYPNATQAGIDQIGGMICDKFTGTVVSWDIARDSIVIAARNASMSGATDASSRRVMALFIAGYCPTKIAAEASAAASA